VPSAATTVSHSSANFSVPATAVCRWFVLHARHQQPRMSRPHTARTTHVEAKPAIRRVTWRNLATTDHPAPRPLFAIHVDLVVGTAGWRHETAQFVRLPSCSAPSQLVPRYQYSRTYRGWAAQLLRLHDVDNELAHRPTRKEIEQLIYSWFIERSRWWSAAVRLRDGGHYHFSFRSHFSRVPTTQFPRSFVLCFFVCLWIYSTGRTGSNKNVAVLRLAAFLCPVIVAEFETNLS